MVWKRLEETDSSVCHFQKLSDKWRERGFSCRLHVFSKIAKIYHYSIQIWPNQGLSSLQRGLVGASINNYYLYRLIVWPLNVSKQWKIHTAVSDRESLYSNLIFLIYSLRSKVQWWTDRWEMQILMLLNKGWQEDEKLRETIRGRQIKEYILQHVRMRSELNQS